MTTFFFDPSQLTCKYSQLADLFGNYLASIGYNSYLYHLSHKVILKILSKKVEIKTSNKYFIYKGYSIYLYIVHLFIDTKDPTIGTQPIGPLPCADRTAPFNGDIPDPKSCSNFYRCSNGRSIIRSCPSGLFFNNATKKCDVPRNVDRNDCE